MSKTLELRTRPAATADATSLVEAAYRALKTAIRENVLPAGPPGGGAGDRASSSA